MIAATLDYLVIPGRPYTRHNRYAEEGQSLHEEVKVGQVILAGFGSIPTAARWKELFLRDVTIPGTTFSGNPVPPEHLQRMHQLAVDLAFSDPAELFAESNWNVVKHPPPLPDGTAWAAATSLLGHHYGGVSCLPNEGSPQWFHGFLISQFQPAPSRGGLVATHTLQTTDASPLLTRAPTDFGRRMSDISDVSSNSQRPSLSSNAQKQSLPPLLQKKRSLSLDIEEWPCGGSDNSLQVSIDESVWMTAVGEIGIKSKKKKRMARAGSKQPSAERDDEQDDDGGSNKPGKMQTMEFDGYEYPKATQAISTYYNLLSQLGWLNLTANGTRARRILLATLVEIRQHRYMTDLNEMDAEWVSKWKELDLPTQDNRILYLPQKRFLHVVWSRHGPGSVNRNIMNRQVNDFLRVTGVMLLPDCREITQTVLSRKLSKDDLDAPNSETTNARWEVLVSKFNDEAVLIDHPEGSELLDDIASYNPNDERRIGIHRDWKWFKDTWMTVIKPLFGEANRRWRMETGGGTGSSEAYQDWTQRPDTLYANYTGIKSGNQTKNKWLAWIYMKDKQAGFVLTSADGSVPIDCENESGFVNGSDSASRLSRAKHRKTMEDRLMELQEQGIEMMSKMTSAVESMVSTTGETDASNDIGYLIDLGAKIRAEISRIDNDTLLLDSQKEKAKQALTKKYKETYASMN